MSGSLFIVDCASIKLYVNNWGKKKQPLEASDCNIKGEVKQLYKGELLQRTTMNNSSLEEFCTTTISLKKLAEKIRQKKVKHNPCSLPYR